MSAFNGTNNVSYLDESIALDHEILKLKGPEPMRFEVVLQLVRSLLKRLSLFYRILEDLSEVMRLVPLAVNNRYGWPTERFKFSCFWAHLARHLRDPIVSEAYKAMAL